MALSWESSPAQDHAAVTPSDSTVFSPPFRALYIGGTGSGNIKVRSIAGHDCAYKVVAGTKLEIAGDKVYATGTDATSIVAWL